MSKATKEEARSKNIDDYKLSILFDILVKSTEHKAMIKEFTTDENGKTISRKKDEMAQAVKDWFKTLTPESVISECGTPDFHSGTMEELGTVALNLATLKVDAQAILDNSLKQDITDTNLISTLSKSCYPVVSNLMARTKSNEKWTQWKIIDLIYKSVDYNPLSKEEDFVKSNSFEIRATRVAKRIAVCVESFNPLTNQFADTEQGYRFNEETGEAELPYAVLVPKLPSAVAGSDKTILVDNDSEQAKETYMPVSVRILDDHYANAYKTKRNNDDDKDLTQEQKWSESLMKWLGKKEEQYQKFIDTKGVKSNAEVVSEDVFETIERLGLAIDNFIGTLQDAETMASNIEGTPEEETEEGTGTNG